MGTREGSKFIGIILPYGIRSNDPSKLVVSLCLNINRYFAGFKAEDNGNSYDAFYYRLRRLRDLLFNDQSEIKITAYERVPTEGISFNIKVDGKPFEFLNNDMPDPLSLLDYIKLRKDLWSRIFPEKILNKASRVKDADPGKITNLFDEQNLRMTNWLFSTRSGIRTGEDAIRAQILNDLNASPLTEKLSQIREAAQINKKEAQIERFAFIEKYYPETWAKLSSFETEAIKNQNATGRQQVSSNSRDIINIFNNAVSNYINGREMDIEEILHSFNALSNEPVLMRLMGLIRDVEIELPRQFVPSPDKSFRLKFEIANQGIWRDENGNPLNILDDFLFFPTKIKAISRRNKEGKEKFAYLVEESTNFYSDSILKAENSYLIEFDKMAQEKTAETIIRSEFERGETEELRAARQDGFTRGIIYTNPGLAEIITPGAYPETDAELKNFEITDNFIIRGHRVAVIINDKNIHSLTGRRLELKLKDAAKPFYVRDRNEGCIHFDTPSSYLKDGKVDSTVSDALFEYSGELLKLKSAFAKSNKIATSEDAADQTENYHDDGLHKAERRFDEVIRFFHFPFNEIKEKIFLNCSYDIPDYFKREGSPKLRFEQKYTFVINGEYLNGGALPLNSASDASAQLTVKDLIETSRFKLKPDAISFVPLENKKPILLYHTKEVKEEVEGKDSIPLSQRETLNTLILRSDNSDGNVEETSSRHVLPERIAFEHAFWYDLLSPNNMSPEESFDWKRKYNCPFLTAQEYENYTQEEVKGKKRLCPEAGCREYCGGTQMQNFYIADAPITPNHLSDPSVVGFDVEFFWNQECTDPFKLPLELVIAEFGGTPGIRPESYLLTAAGSAEEFRVRNRNKHLEIFLKKGMRVFARLRNRITSKFIHHLDMAWWQQYFQNAVNIKANQNDKNRPRVISLVHAIKKPLIDPIIEGLFSLPLPQEQYKYAHIQAWLLKKYPDENRPGKSMYELGRNVLTERIKINENDINAKGSTKIRLSLRAHFERLDAYKLEPNNKVKFLPDEMPTGGLELWMRKEDFIDDPNQIVLSSDDTDQSVNHKPDQPILPFADEKNIFYREQKIDFNNDITAQLKNESNVRHIGTSRDLFKSVASSLELQFDAKSAKFEERKYIIKNASKYRGYFTDKIPNDDGDGGEYSRDSEEFNVLLLNNQQPSKPEVKFSVTTIRETRTKDDDTTESSQTGSLVTIYLKRGRLQSGRDERVGIIVKDNSLYSRLFASKDLLSKVGRDIVSDRFLPRSQFLEPSNFKLSGYDAMYDEADGLGIVHYLPEFDEEKQLWKIEVELDVKTAEGKHLHNPFVSFSLVHYQPLSVNYLKLTDASNPPVFEDLKNDCRLSEVETSVWCYLLPERKLSVSFDKPGIASWLGSLTDWLDPWGSVRLTLSYDYESLHHFNKANSQPEGEWLVRSNFILSVEGSDDEMTWYPVMSKVDSGEDVGKWRLMHPLLTNSILSNKGNQATIDLKFRRHSNPDEEGNPNTNLNESEKFSHFRVRFVEVEWFTEKTWDELGIDLQKEIVNNEEMRVRYVELIY